MQTMWAPSLNLILGAAAYVEVTPLVLGILMHTPFYFKDSCWQFRNHGLQISFYNSRMSCHSPTKSRHNIVIEIVVSP